VYIHDCSKHAYNQPPAEKLTDRGMCWFEMIRQKPLPAPVYDDGINYGASWDGMDLTAFLPKDRSIHVVV
jgi:hypothetical protein